MNEAKPFVISKWEVWEAYKRVKANQGAAGVDEQSIADFERNLKRNLYKIWNRMRLRTCRVIGQLLSAAGADGEDTEGKRRRKATGDSNRIGPDRANGGEVETGAGGGSAVPSGFLRVSTGEVGLGCSGASAVRNGAL